MKNPLVYFFDWLKKYRMERMYEHQEVWGRSDTNKDIDAAVSMLTGRHFGTCLDIGTGLGHYAERLAPQCDHILATDISDKAVVRARERLAHIKNITFAAGNARTMRLDDPFDLVVLGDMLYYLGDTRFPAEFEEVLKHIAGLVAPGGTLLMSNFIAPWSPRERSANYAKQIGQYGLSIEKETVFTEGQKSWHQVVLHKR